MPKQFLTNPDGSIPANTNAELLKREGIPFVLPTAMWEPTAGMMLVESDPEMIDGVWRQKWIEVPIQTANYEE